MELAFEQPVEAWEGLGGVGVARQRQGRHEGQFGAVRYVGQPYGVSHSDGVLKVGHGVGRVAAPAQRAA